MQVLVLYVLERCSYLVEWCRCMLLVVKWYSWLVEWDLISTVGFQYSFEDDDLLLFVTVAIVIFVFVLFSGHV